MNRIDLHIHTQNCKKGDGSKRNIEVKKFIEIMHNNQIKVCAITNHNKFDKAEYNNIASKELNFVIFPGIELDIQFDIDNIRHIILICNPTKIDQFYQEFDNEPNRDYDNFLIEYEDFINKVKKFNENEIIIIPHFYDKDKKRALNIANKDLLEKDMNDYVVILETANLKSMGIINAHDEVALIGSDIKDWSNYSNESLKLPELKFSIDSFSKFYELANNPKVFIKSALDGCNKYRINTNQTDGSNVIDLFEDINVIFGEKGSGKSYLLKKYVNPSLTNEGLSVFLHEGKNYQNSYDTMIKNIVDSVNINKDIKKNIEKELDYILNYQEVPLNNFITTYMEAHRDVITNGKAKLILKTEVSYTISEINVIDNLIDNTKEKVEKIENIVKINTDFRKNDDTHKNILNRELYLLNNEIIDEITMHCKKIFTTKNTDLFLKNLKSVLKKKTGKKSKPNNIGFSLLVAKRTERIKMNFCLLEHFESLKVMKNVPIGYLPNKGKISALVQVIVLDIDDKITKGSVFAKNTIVANRNLISKLKDFSIANFREINTYLAFEKEKTSEEYISEIIRKSNKIIRNDGEEYDPSEGEKAILSISGILESNSYDCYLFDEIERGLGNKYISNYLIPRLKFLRDSGKLIALSTHNANIAINTLPSQTIYCDYIDDNGQDNIYYTGNMYSNKLFGIKDNEPIDWEDKALIHLEGSKKMFDTRRNLYGC